MHCLAPKCKLPQHKNPAAAGLSGFWRVVVEQQLQGIDVVCVGQFFELSVSWVGLGFPQRSTRSIFFGFSPITRLVTLAVVKPTFCLAMVKLVRSISCCQVVSSI